MRTQRNLLSRLLNRGALGLIAAATALALVVPVAGATPETDAAAAIDAAWTAAGGDGSALGAKNGDVFAVDGGFAQNFAGGAIYFAPDSGAHIMQGAILEKFRAAGGPADLGFPTIDESDGRAPQSRNTLFSAADRPVIFWTPDNGAWVVRGAINAAWDRVGGSTGVLGVPIGDETYDGDVVAQKFSGGEIGFDTRTKTFTTVPPDLAAQLGDLTIPGDATSAINAAYRAAGGAAGPLGDRQGAQFTIDPDGVGQEFAGGKIYFSPATGAHVVSGAILEKYDAVGGPTGDLGLPNAAEADGGVPGSRVSSFAATDNPVIFWTPEHGANVVRGAMKAAWDKLGGAAGALGVPVSDQSTDGDTVSQKFSGGQLSWDSKTNTFTTDPANLAESLGGLEVPTQVSAPPAAPNPPKDNAFAFHTWWLWWIIPLALLLLASAYALRSQRRRAAEPLLADGVDTDGARWPSADTWKEPEADAGPPPPWSSRQPVTPPETPEDHELFTHRGAHEAAEEDPDAVDTAPTRVPVDGGAYPARHAAAEPFGSGPGDEEPYGPGPGSLFAPVYGAVPPPVEPDDRDVYGRFDADAGHPDEAADAYTEVSAEIVYDAPRYVPEYGGREYAAPEYDDADEVPLEDLYEEEPYRAPDEVEHAIPPAIHLPLEDPTVAPAGYPVKGRMSTGTYHTPDRPGYDQVVAEIWFTDAQHAEANGFTPAD